MGWVELRKLDRRRTTLISTHLCEKYERYPLIVGNHLSIVGLVLGYRLAPRHVVGVFHPAVARHELDVCAGEVNRRPTRDWITYVLQHSQPRQARYQKVNVISSVKFTNSSMYRLIGDFCTGIELSVVLDLLQGAKWRN